MYFAVRGRAVEQGIVFRLLTPGQGIIFVKIGSMTGSIFVIFDSLRSFSPGGDSLLVSDGGGQTLLGFAKCCLVYLWVWYLVHNQYILLMKKLDQALNIAAQYPKKP